MREPSDESLMQSYAQGDVEAFEMLYRRHSGPLYRFILRQVTDAATANDLYQGSWEKIINARMKYRPTAPFAAWMYRIARNHVVDYFRASKPSTSLADDHADEDANLHAEKIDAEKRSQALFDAIAQLPAEQKEAILLKLEGDLSVNDIAAATGVNRETAKSRLRYAVAKLKKELPGKIQTSDLTASEQETPRTA